MRDADALDAREWVERLRKPRVPLCPQLRAAKADWSYPIAGYCIPEAPPGRLMIPTIEEYRTRCTTPRFRECRWFRTTTPGVIDERKAA